MLSYFIRQAVMLPDDDTRCINIIITNCLMEEGPVSLSVLRNATGLASSPLKHGWFWAEAKATPSLLSQTPAARTKQFRILLKKTAYWIVLRVLHI